MKDRLHFGHYLKGKTGREARLSYFRCLRSSRNCRSWEERRGAKPLMSEHGGVHRNHAFGIAFIDHGLSIAKRALRSHSIRYKSRAEESRTATGINLYLASSPVIRQFMMSANRQKLRTYGWRASLKDTLVTW